MVKKRSWKSAEDPLEQLLSQLAPSHKTIRRELMIAIAQARFHLNRASESVLEAVEVRPKCNCL
jgi:hypothetical protein